MADIHVITGDGREFDADSYAYDRHGSTVTLRVYNPASCDDVIDMMEKCNFSSFDLIAEYPGDRRIESRFVSYELADCTTVYKPAGTVLEFYLRKVEVV